MELNKASEPAKLTESALSTLLHALVSPFRASPSTSAPRRVAPGTHSRRVSATESSLSSLTASPTQSLASRCQAPPPSPPAQWRSPLKRPQPGLRVAALPSPPPTSGSSASSKATLHKAAICIETKVWEGSFKWLDAGLYYDERKVGQSHLASNNPTSGPGGKRALRLRKEESDWRMIKDPAVWPKLMYWGKERLVEERDFWLEPEFIEAVNSLGPRTRKGVIPSEEALQLQREAQKRDMETDRKPPPYRKLVTNYYFERKPERAENPAVCLCAPPANPEEPGCGPDCMNRLLQYVCDKDLCPCGSRCSNVPFGPRQNIAEGKDGLTVIWTGDRGFGLKTAVPIKAGDFIIEYRGEIISRDESYRRVTNDYKDEHSYYFLDYDGHEVIDAGQRGNAARFVNHSCDPNTHVVRCRLAKFEEFQVGIFALKDIPANTELTYDYGWQDFSSLRTEDDDDDDESDTDDDNGKDHADLSLSTTSSPLTSLAPTSPTKSATASTLLKANAAPLRQRCFCGAPNCSGYLGGKRKPVVVVAVEPESPSVNKPCKVSRNKKPRGRPSNASRALAGDTASPCPSSAPLSSVSSILAKRGRPAKSTATMTKSKVLPSGGKKRGRPSNADLLAAGRLPKKMRDAMSLQTAGQSPNGKD